VTADNAGQPLTDVLPEPPTEAPAAIALVTEAVSAWRLHWEVDPLRPPLRTTGVYRFDAPAGEFPVLYANRDRLACFAEVYGDTGTIEASQGPRHLSLVSALRPLRLVALDDALTRRRCGLDGRIGTAKQYAVTQQWSRSFHVWFPEADGLRYSSRHAGEQHNYALFLDRCAPELAVYPQGELQDLRRVVLFAADMYALAVKVAWRS